MYVFHFFSILWLFPEYAVVCSPYSHNSSPHPISPKYVRCTRHDHMENPKLEIVHMYTCVHSYPQQIHHPVVHFTFSPFHLFNHEDYLHWTMWCEFKISQSTLRMIIVAIDSMTMTKYFLLFLWLIRFWWYTLNNKTIFIHPISITTC